MVSFVHLLRMKVIIILFICLAFSGSYVLAEEKGGFDITATKALSQMNKLQWHGYYEFEYWSKDNSKKTFDAHKVTFWMGLPINDKVSLSTEIEYEHFPRLPGKFTEDASEDGKDQRTGGSGAIKVDSAQLRITPVKNTAAYLGIFYVPFGIEYVSYPGHKNKLVTRPKVMKSGGIISGTWSDVGIGVNQTVDNVGQLDLYLVNGDAKNSGISRDSSSGGNDNKSLGFKVQLDDLVEGLNIGGSYISGKWDTEDRLRSSRLGAHLRLDMDKMTGMFFAPTFIGEYVTGTDVGASSVTGKDKGVEGMYFQLSSYLHPKFELVARHGQYNNDQEKTDNLKNEMSLGFVLHLWDNFQVKSEYQWNFEKKSRRVNNNLAVVEFVAYW